MGQIRGATKGKIWRDAIRRAVQGDPKRIDRLAVKLCEMAEEGDMQAMKEIGDRLDGKPLQAHGGEEGPLEMVIRWGQPK